MKEVAIAESDNELVEVYGESWTKQKDESK